MKIGTRTYVTKSVCPCGFPALRDGVPIGKVYTVDEDSKRMATLQCGGCGRRASVAVINAKDSKGEFHPIVEGIFELSDAPHGGPLEVA